jgi:zinc protease
MRTTLARHTFRAVGFLLWSACLLPLAAGERAMREPDAPAFPPEVGRALAKLPKEAQPVETRTARSGALYALLPNGAGIIVRERHNAPVISVQAWVRTGAIHEGAMLGAGLSHFCEHLLFKGTTQRPSGILDQEIRGAGGDDNAYTTTDHTVYHIEGAADGIATAFDALADMLMNSTFPPDETKTEHGVVYKEIERALDTPENRLWNAWARTLYHVHPYRVPVLGYPEQFQKVTRDEVYAYYKRRYVPQRVTFVAVGDFRAAEILPKMARTLAAWAPGSTEEVVVPEEPVQMAPREVTVVHPRCQVPKFFLGFPSVPLCHPDLYALDVLASVLGDGRSSRLYREVKDRQDLVLSISAYDYTPLYAGEFAVSATAEPAKLAAARAAVLAVLENARQEAPSEEELARAKRKVKAQKVFSEMTAEQVATALGSDWINAGDLDFSETYVEGIQNVTPADVLRVARKYLDPQHLNYAVLLPPTAEAAAAAQPAAAGTKEEADVTWLQGVSGAELKHAEVLAGQPVWELLLANGVHVVLRRDDSLPAVHISFALLGGQRWEPPELAGAGGMLAEMLDRGTKNRSKLQLAAQVEDLGASLSTFGGRNTYGVQLRGLKADLPKLLDLGADVLLRPKFAPEELERVRQETLSALKEREEELYVLNSRLLRPLLYGTHPYSREVLGTPETVSRITAADLLRLQSEWLRPENLGVAVVGDFSPKEALTLVQKAFAGLKAAGPLQAPTLKVEPLAAGREAQQALPGLEGAFETLGFRGVPLSDSDRDVLDVISGALAGLGGRLNTAVREEKGMAYDVGVFSENQLDGGAVVFYVQTDAGKLKACLDAMWEQIKRLRDTAMPQAELDGVKQHLAGLEADALQQQGELAQRLALADLYGQDARVVFGRRKRLLAVTPEQVQAAALKYLDLKLWAKVVVEPAAK